MLLLQVNDRIINLEQIRYIYRSEEKKYVKVFFDNGLVLVLFPEEAEVFYNALLHHVTASLTTEKPND